MQSTEITKLPAYNSITECPKCLYLTETKHVRYTTGTIRDGRSVAVLRTMGEGVEGDGEFLECTCEKCGWIWVERCADG